DNQIIGWDNDIPVVTLDLVVNGNTATIKATLDYSYTHHADITGDDLAALGQVSVLALDSDGDSAAGTVEISISDDVPAITALAPVVGMLIVDESNLAVNATADYKSLFNIAMGADVPGSMTFAFQVTTASGLIDVATGAKIILQSLGNIVEGRLAGSPTTVAFRLSVGPDGQATLDQMRAVQHADPANADDSVSLSATLIRLVATVTDADGDQASAMVYVGSTLAFRDDGPSIEVAQVDTNSILLATQDGETRGAAFDVATADLASAFIVTGTSYGADGQQGAGTVTWSYALALGTAVPASGLTSDGLPITLALVAGTVVGSAGGNPVFSVAVDPATGIVTLTQFAEIDHSLPGSSTNFASQFAELGSNLIQLMGTATIYDRDGDASSATVGVDLGGNIRFADDGPAISATGDAPLLLVDESDFSVNAVANLSSLFAPMLDFGADGEGSVAFALGASAGPSGLVDALTGEAVILSSVGGVVYGRTSASEVFRISVAADGTVTFDQSRAILHVPDTGPDQEKSLAPNLVTLTATVTDGDGDTASSTADISSYLVIRDDGPQAINDEDNVARDGQTFADGNVLTALGGIDDNGADGAPDSPGADGGLYVAGVAFGATTGTVGAALAGEYGFLTLAADGSYQYLLDPADPAVAALGANETLTDSFTYTVKDADGDSSTATITISITGANDFPIARADTNWVLDGPGGSDPTAVGNVLHDLPHPGAPSGNFADTADNDPNLEPITVTSAGTYAGLYGTLVIGSNGAYTYTLNEDHPLVNALNAGQTLVENFGYTVSDGLLAVDSTLSITVYGSNDVPVIGAVVARVSEEGLLGGIADAAPNATLDTTNSHVFAGTLPISDVDAGQSLSVTLGDPGAVLTAGGVPVTWAGVGTGTLIGSAGGSEVIRVTLAPGGAYTVTLSHGIDHPNVALEDLKEFSIPVSVSDGVVTTVNATAITVIIEDDAPVATGETGSSSQPQQDVNTLFILDFSDSIDATELDTMLSAVKHALTQLDNAASGELGISFVIFSSGSFASPNFTTAADANLYLDSLNPAVGGVRPEEIGLNTNYTGAIQTALANFTPVEGASNQVFFLSDGNPNQSVQFGGFPPSVINSLTAATATAWNTFIDANAINVTAIGIDNNPLQPLSIQRLSDVDLNDAPGNQPILVNDFEDLVATLLEVIVPDMVSGDLDANDAYGGDGGHILAITIGAVTYTWDGASSISVSSGGAISGTSLNAVATPMGGALTLDFATGQYFYQPPTPIIATATEVFSYVIVDNDGDRATASLSVTITAAVPPVVIDLDGDGVEFVSSAAGVHFDYNGDGTAESTAWVGADDGLLVIDKNSDGKVNDGSEVVFGFGGLSDLAGLAARYDSNGDGKLEATDIEFAKFAVWRDADSDGVTDEGELQSLATAGIASISLVSDGRGYSAAGGEVTVVGEATYVRSDGSTGRLADASFATNFVNDPQRQAAAASGMGTALIAAGLVAAFPLAARVSEAPLLDNHELDDTLVLKSHMVEPTSNERADDTDVQGHYLGGDAAPEIDPAVGSARHFAGNEQENLPDEDLGSSISTRGQLPGVSDQAMLDGAGTGPGSGSGAGRAGPFASAGDEALMMAAAPLQASPGVPDPVREIIEDALEGRTVDLDALLGPRDVAELALSQFLFQDPANGFFADNDMFSLGSHFGPDIAEQHVVVQMEQAAAVGHA
ncbi:MAG: DUF5801 repeats-in-toxin domain-containing protein, partial [Sphingorhabdus sp.]